MSFDASQQDGPVSETETPHKFSYRFSRKSPGTGIRPTTQKLFHKTPLFSTSHSSAFDMMDLPPTVPVSPFARVIAESLSDDEDLFEETLQPSKSYPSKSPSILQDEENFAQSQSLSDETNLPSPLTANPFPRGIAGSQTDDEDLVEKPLQHSRSYSLKSPPRHQDYFAQSQSLPDENVGSDICMQSDELESTNIPETASGSITGNDKFLYSLPNTSTSSDCAIIEPSYPVVSLDSSSDDDVPLHKRIPSQSLLSGYGPNTQSENGLLQPSEQTLKYTGDRSPYVSTETTDTKKTNFQTGIKDFFDNLKNKSKFQGLSGDSGSVLKVEVDRKFIKQENTSTRKKEDGKVEIKRKQNKYWIAGIQVKFPGKPYGVQMAVMEKTIRCCKNAEFSIVESPTGTGKTLALLCSALAWQKKMRELSNQPSELGAIGQTDGVNLQNGITENRGPTNIYLQDRYQVDRPAFQLHMDEGASAHDMLQPPLFPLENQQEQVKKNRVPRIYYGTRTHKQIQQVVKELRKTAYSDIKMAVLASREQTCIQEYGNTKIFKNKTEMCHELLDPEKGPGCRYDDNVFRIKTHAALGSLGYQMPMDIEDLLKVGRKHRACPYFAARSLASNSDLVICPYNYLLDPIVRDSLNICLNGDIVILDEAHNIEDITRDAASASIIQFDILFARMECLKCSKINEFPECYLGIANFLSILSDWLDGQKEKLQRGNDVDKQTFVMSGMNAIASFALSGINIQTVMELKGNINKVLSDLKKPEEENEKHKKKILLSGNTNRLLSELVNVLTYIYTEKMQFVHDYDVVISRDLRKRPPPDMAPDELKSGKCWQYSVNFWCHNSGIVFGNMCLQLRGLVLSSGTLSPMESFESELGVHFQNKLEANHIVPHSQLFIRSISNGPKMFCLNSQYKNVGNLCYQDDLGELILRICKIVPHGVLCFFPSYSLMDRLTDRWQTTQLWQKFEEIKEIFLEPKKSSDLGPVMNSFYNCINSSEHEDAPNGALLFAIMRGKISEGFDFADNAARAVITVGIPFPNLRDLQIGLKKKYNDTNFVKKGLLNGNMWYETQAYRPLNQALGRCIRHIKDWGAIILVDDRFKRDSSSVSRLSKWLQKHLIHHDRCEAFLTELAAFIKQQKNLEQQIHQKMDIDM